MRRDYGGEILVAIGTISVLVFAVAFAVILIVAQQGRPEAVATASAIGQAGANAPEASATSQSVIGAVPSATRAVETPTATLAATVVEPTEAPPTATRDAGSETTTAQPSATPTDVQPSATLRPPTRTQPPLTATSTRAAPSATPTARPTLTSTSTLLPATATPTATPTATLTATSSATPTLTATATHTMTPTHTATASATPTATAVPPTSTPALSASGCPIPPGWLPYAVQSGDTLFSLARGSGSTVSALQSGNCLADETIFAAQELYLPSPQAITTADTIEGCSAPGVFIDPGLFGQMLSGVFEVRGTARIEDFAFYRLEIASAGSEVFAEIRRGVTPVVDGVLARVSSARFAPGSYRLRLVVVDARGGFPQPCAIPLIIQ